MKNRGMGSAIGGALGGVKDSSLREKADEKKPLTFFEILGSTFAAAIGVQSKANKTRDFSQGKPTQFILAGLVFASIFVLGVVALVRTVLASVA